MIYKKVKKKIMMIERQEFATEHIHVVKPLRISLNITWYLAACTGKNCT